MKKKTKKLTNAEIQKRYKDRMSGAGYIPLHIWIKPKWKQIIEDCVKELKCADP